MKYRNGIYYVEVKDHQYKIHPFENFILKLRYPLKSLITQYQVQNETQIRKNQKVVENKGNLEIKNYTKKKQPIKQQLKYKPPICHSCKRNNWLEFDKGYYCQNCEYIINKQKHQIDRKVRRQDQYFSTRLSYANKKRRQMWMNMVNTTSISTEDMINKLQSLKGKTKLNFFENISNDEMNIRILKFEEDLFSKNVQGISKISFEVLLMKFSQVKPQVKNMNINYYDIYYTVTKNRDDEEIVNGNYEDNEYDYIKLNDSLLLIIISEEKMMM